MTTRAAAVHAQRKRRKAGCRRTVRKPLLERRVNVTGCAPLQHYEEEMEVRRYQPGFSQSNAVALTVRSLWGALARGFQKSKEKPK